MKDSLAFIGLATIGIVFLFCILLIWSCIRDYISDIRYRYKRKHRFDKPPTAKCYCKDCLYFGIHTEYCAVTRKYMSDSCFCSHAVPRKHDPEKEGD